MHTTSTAATAIRIALFLLLLFAPAQGWAQSGMQHQAAGKVARIQGAAYVLRSGAPTHLAVGDSVFSGDALETKAESRLELAMIDGTILTLGSDTHMDLTAYVWMPEAETGLGALRLGKGAFRAVTGALTRVVTPAFTVDTPLAAIGIRGTDFWGGFLKENALDVLFVAGNKRIAITNAMGTTVLEAPGEGLTVQSGLAPGPVKIWPEAKRKRAFDTVGFGPR